MVKGFLCFVRELLKRPFRHTSIRTLYEHFSMLGAYWGPNRRSAVYLKYELYWLKHRIAVTRTGRFGVAPTIPEKR